MDEVILKIENVTKRFGGMVALQDVSVQLHKGEILGLIGPNGAGKTTLFNCITGEISPTSGKVWKGSRQISGKMPNAVCREGIGRTFQIVKPFSSMTVQENVAVGAMAQGLPVKQALEKAEEILTMLELQEISGRYPGELTLSLKKRLEVARALASDPDILLLDEVMAGLNIQEMSAFAKLVQEINDRGVSIIIVEHIMQAVRTLCKRVIVLNFGKVLTEGKTEDVMSDERVIAAYLGEKHHA